MSDVKNNRSTPFMERPRLQAVGNNRNTRAVSRIKKFIESNGPRTFHEIYDHLNNNWTHGVTRHQLGNVLGKGPFIQIDEVLGGGTDGRNTQGLYDNV